MSQPRISRDSLIEIQRALREYEELLAGLEHDRVIMDNTRKTYHIYADMFVRWLRGEFEPGGRNQSVVRRQRR